MKTYERNQDRLHIMQTKYDRLKAIPDAERSLDQMDELLKLSDQIEKLETKLVKLKAQDSVTKEEADANAVRASDAMGDFVQLFNIYHTAETGLFWYYEHGEWHPAKPPAFHEKFKGIIHMNENSYKLFSDAMDKQDRKINNAFYGWTDKPGYLNMLSIGQFCQPVEANGYHAIFDLLFTSLGGGKQENIEHLEKLILAKWQYPNNYLLPCVVFADGGGTGKSVLIAKLMPTLFGAENVAGNLSMEQSFGKWQKPIAGKVIVFVNEAPEDREDDKAILRVVHSPTIYIEKKGFDAIEAVNTALYFIGTNPKAGGYAIRLANNNVDRRFSILHGTKPLKWYVAEAYELSHDNGDYAGEQKMTGELQHVLTDPEEVGRWLYCKQRQYGQITSLRALHGADYAKQAAETREMHTRVCEAVFLDSGFEYIRSEVLFQLFKSNGGPHKNISFHRLVSAWLEDHPELGISYETGWPWHDSAMERRPQARLYVRDASGRLDASGKREKLRSNDRVYGQEELTGRWTWWIDVI